MAPRTQRTPEPDHIPAQEPSETTILIDQMAITGLHLHMDSIAAQVQDIANRLEGPVQSDPGQESIKVQRRRSLDAMEFALKRLSSPDPRPSDDDSPQVLRDAIHEVIACRQIIQDLMQASSSVYQRGLTAIRDMTNR